MGQVHVPVTFGDRDNYHTELIDFDVANINLPYNAILGYPTLSKFMAATHHGYNVLKMPGSGGVITIACDEKEALRSLERAYQTAAIESSDGDRAVFALMTAPKKKKQLPDSQASGAPDGTTSSFAPTDEAPSAPA